MEKLTHKQLHNKALLDQKTKRNYDALEREFQLLREFVNARTAAGLTQSQVAERMGTKGSVVSRFETGGGKHSPSLKTMRAYAAAVDCDLKIELIPIEA